MFFFMSISFSILAHTATLTPPRCRVPEQQHLNAELTV
jgi:hypothetical protein